MAELFVSCAKDEFVLYVDGLPGAGKSSLVRSLELSCDLLFPEKELTVLYEYICDPMLDIMTSDIARYGFAYQIMMLQRRVNTLNTILTCLKNRKSVIVDRSLIGDASFALNLVCNKLMTKIEWDVYDTMMLEARNLQEQIQKSCGNCCYAYVDVSPEEARNRIINRARSSESSYTLDYLNGLEAAHTDMYTKLGVTPIRVDWPEKTPSLHHSGDKIYDCSDFWSELDIRV